MDRRQVYFSKVCYLSGVAVLAAFIGGCGSGVTDAPESFEISGYVNYDGEPVPFGMIVFVDTVSQYRTVCKINDGYYESQARKGHKGGKFDVLVTGYVNEGEGGMEGPSLWQGAWTTQVELAAESVEKTFDISKDEVEAAVSVDPIEDT
ncbi:MAG: hypothetical protein ABGZ35_11160 [Planctomycetaceae bacterium]